MRNKSTKSRTRTSISDKSENQTSAIKHHRLRIYPMKTFMKLTFNKVEPKLVGAPITSIQDRFMQAISTVLS